jgi:hypothetical protein
MSADSASGPGAQPAGAGGAPGGPGDGGPSEEELRAAYEAELSRVTVTDMMAQAAVSLLNLAARRLGPPPGSEQPAGTAAQGGRDLDQAGDAIDGVRALLGILERRIPQEVRPLRDALSQLQMAYAHEVGAAGAGTASGPGATSGPGAASGPGATAAAAAGQAPPAAPATGAPGPASGPEGGAEGTGEDGGAGSNKDEQEPGPGPAESSGRLWVPGR